MGLEGARNPRKDEVVASSMGGMGSQVGFDLGTFGVDAQALCSILPILASENSEVAEPVGLHELIASPDDRRGGFEDGCDEVALLFGLKTGHGGLTWLVSHLGQREDCGRPSADVEGDGRHFGSTGVRYKFCLYTSLCAWWP